MSQITTRGKFITFEGIDGAGKSAHIDHVKTVITEMLGHRCYSTREPGGTKVGEKLREIMIHDQMDPNTEYLIMAASRNEHVKTIISPKLDAGDWVLSDRFLDSSFAYQGAGRGVLASFINSVARSTLNVLIPDLTFLFDVPLEVAKDRMGTRLLDKFEAQSRDFFSDVQKKYHELAAANPHRIIVIDATKTIPEIQQQLTDILMTRKWNRDFFIAANNFLGQELANGTARLEMHPFGGSISVVDNMSNISGEKK